MTENKRAHDICKKFPHLDEYAQLKPLNLNKQIQLQQATARTSKSIKSTHCGSARDVIYGELVILGYNGSIYNPIDQEDPFFDIIHSDTNYITKRKSKFVLRRRSKPNGVRPESQHDCKNNDEVNKIIKNSNRSVAYTMSRNRTIVVEYSSDENVDMFQIGRSFEAPIDFIVLDTLTPDELKAHSHPICKNESTVSRYSCRIVVERQAPYTARIYAAGFDTLNNIFLGDRAIKWTKREDNKVDGLTTNGILISHPDKNSTKRCSWAEVSINGALFEANDTNRGTKLLTNWTNILQDGTLIDVCGATLVWRSRRGLESTPSKSFVEQQIININNCKPQCPVSLNTLVFTAKFDGVESNRLNFSNRDEFCCPMVYLNCGHVQGNHSWGLKNDNQRECPLCRVIGPCVKLVVGQEPSLYCDDTRKIGQFKPYSFRPCGHMASEDTCLYWSRVQVPAHGAICPFCAVKLDTKQPFIKLIFQQL